MLNEYKKWRNFDVYGPQDAVIMSLQKNIDHSELLILLNKSGMVKSKEGRAQMGISNATISHDKKQRFQPSH